MKEEQSKTKIHIVTNPNARPYDPETNPDGYLPIPLWVCRCDHHELEPPWYQRLADRLAGLFR